MSKLSELAYDIEQLYIEGYSPKSIAMQLGCPIGMVYDWLEDSNLEDPDVAESPQEEIYSPYNGA
jgi:DNA-directed RNA polymerase specialized sigma24 family protein